MRCAVVASPVFCPRLIFPSRGLQPRQTQRTFSCFGRCSQPPYSLVWQLERITAHVSALRKSHLDVSTFLGPWYLPTLLVIPRALTIDCNVKVVNYCLSPKLYANLPDGLEWAITVLSTGLASFALQALLEKDLVP